MASITRNMAITLGALLALSALALAADVIFMPQNDFQPLSGQAPSIPIDISPLFDNRGFGKAPNEADFDGSGNAYPADFLPPARFIYRGFDYEFPQYTAAGNDNLIAAGQMVSIPCSKYSSVQLLAASESGMASGTINATYADGSTTSGAILVPAWWSWPYPNDGDLVFPHYLTNETVDYNRSNIYQSVNWLDSSKELVSLVLPDVSGGSDTSPGGAAIGTRLHIFALTVSPVPDLSPPGPQLEVRYARSTQKWVDGTNKTQIIEVLVTNVGSGFVLSNHSVTLSIDSPDLQTVSNGTLKRLRAGDQALVEIGVVNRDDVAIGSSGNTTVVISGQGGVNSSVRYTFNATYGVRPYEATYESISSHESPNWYNNAKYGIFIHWGLYSVPGWGNSGRNENYAEWYWWDLNKGPDYSSQTYQYHLNTYGPDVVYDDFIGGFTADTWDPKDWVDLFADAGATYFVQVSKHHDGYALFDLPANVTERTSVAQFPHRNLLKELFDAAKQYQPHLHRATYFSLPEWFHPDYRKYGFSQWLGGNATNPFTNKSLAYTGYVPVSDYIDDVILPEMNALADLGTEIMWCDIGGPNKTAEFASNWFNRAASSSSWGNRQVVMNARCGLPGDFDTPEYTRYGSVQTRKWESNLGMDPFSYGYNRATPLAQYMNASSIVTSLIDIVSKNGNFLLDIGPQANGTIVEVEQRNLREAGVWIHDHAEAIFNTTYWFVTPEEGGDIRFTQSADAFYIAVLGRPNATIVLDSPVPWVEGDEVTVVGGQKKDTIVPSEMLGNGSLRLNVSDEVADADQYTWVFRISY